MTSILTNTSAISAVASLTATQKSLAQVQNEISTGLKVSSAEDNAAYYSIATELRTQVGDLSAVSDSLNLGTSVVGTATAAVTNLTSILQSIQSQLVAAKQPGTDLDSIQTNIAALNSQLANTVSSASFNGVNLLDGSTSANPQVQFVAGVTGLGANTKVTDLTVDTTNTNFSGITSDPEVIAANTADTNAASAQAAYNTAQTAFTNALAASGASTQGSTAFTTLYGAGATITAGVVSGFAAGSLAANLFGSNASASYTTTDGNFTTGTSTDGALVGLYGNAGTTPVTQANDTGTTANATSLGALAYVADTAAGNLYQVGRISLSSGNGGTPATTSTQIDAYIAQVGKALDAANTTSETLGAAAKNIDLQSTYTTSLSSSITTGIGSLVDADLNEASTRLNALQTQQQLGIQSLSIANSNTQLILKLFQ